MKADLVGAKLSGKIDAQGTLLSWLDGRLGQVEEGVRTLKGSVVFWGALPTALVAVAAIWAYLHGVKP